MFRKVLRKSLSTIFYLGVLLKKKEGIIVLNYHRVNDTLRPDELVVSTKTFKEEMEFLKKQKYRVIGLKELVSELTGSRVGELVENRDSPQKMGQSLFSQFPFSKTNELTSLRAKILITFDDGFRDNYLNAFPVLKEFGFPAVIFLTTGFINTDKKFKRYEHVNTTEMLNYDEIKEMAKYGISFGSHTVTHPHLTRISLEEAKKEIEESKRVVNELAGPSVSLGMVRGMVSLSNHSQVCVFCYPAGDYNADIKDLVKAAGFDCAFTVKPGRNKPGCDLFELRRTAINGNDSLFDFKKKLAGAYDPLHRLVQKKRNSKKIGTVPKIGDSPYFLACHSKGVAKNPREEEIPACPAGRLQSAEGLPQNDKNNPGLLQDDRRLNVLYIIWSLGLGGAERVVINLAKGLDKTKFNPLVCCLNDKGIFADGLEKEGIEVIALNKNGKFDFGIINKLISVIKKNNIKIVNTHLWGANFWGRIAAKLAGVPAIIATEHNEDIWKKGFHFFLDKWLCRWTSKIIVVSNSVKEFYVNKGISPEKIEVIYNGIDMSSLKNREKNRDRHQFLEEFGIKEDETILAVIGRLVPQKGHRYFLLALKGLLENHRCKGLIVGAGPLETELKQLSKDLGLNGNVIFTGLRQDVPELLKAVDILVMPSLREGLPMIALEAMVSGVPVIAANVGGVTELIREGKTGLLIEPGNQTALKEAVIRLINDKELAQSLINNARKRIEEEFTISKMIDKTQGLYEEMAPTMRDKNVPPDSVI